MVVILDTAREATVATYTSERSSRVIGVGVAANASRVASGDQAGAARTVKSAPPVTRVASRDATSTTHTCVCRKSPSNVAASSRRRRRASASASSGSCVR